GLDEPRGALIASVVPDGPAARAGLQQGDVILTFNGQRIEDSRDLTQRVGATAIGNSSRVEILRGGNRRTLNLRLQERPSEQTLAAANPAPNATPPEAPEGAPGVAQSSLGVSVRPASAEDRTRYELGANEAGLVVTAVEPDSDAASKGIRVGDIILQAGGRSVRTAAELTTAVDAARRASRPLLLQVDGRAGRRFIAAEVSE
ncbi:MAG TPA: PDZ domain-containing protein, partial [Verrucomicrobiae bacterium]|nr:PDZ domain-containing protein [Verrucomicrobiae bacterium]